MKKSRLILIVFLLAFPLLIICINLAYLLSIPSNDDYPADTFLDNEQNRSALVIVAHDDDAVLFAGTTSMLASRGWKIDFLTFYTDKYRPDENPIRKEEMKKVKEIQGLNRLMLVDLTLRRGLDTIDKPWTPVPYSEFNELFRIDSARYYIAKAINDAQPSVIFMADRDFGFYGHPEHVLVGQITEQICMGNNDKAGFTVKRLYQAVLPASHAQKIMGDRTEAAAIYPSKGMPAPEVQVDIKKFSKMKMQVMKAHASQHRNLKKFVPYYNYYPAKLYFGIFSREYFNVIEIQ